MGECPRRNLMDYSLILNPVAGKGRGRELVGLVEEAFRARGASYELLQTGAPGDATRLAAGAQGDVVVSLGGDGTVNEIANGLVGTHKVLGVLPAGSGNDFIKAVGIPKSFQAALEVLFSREELLVDLGYVQTAKGSDERESQGRHFANGVGVGFDAAVAVRKTEIKSLSGVLVYVAAVFQTLGRYLPPHFVTEFDGTRNESTNLLIAIGNGPCAGGGFYLTPDARTDDGLLDVCLVDAVSIPTILRLMPKVMLGKHRHAKQVKFLRARQITLRSEQSFYVHADGEIVGRGVNVVKVSVLEKGLSVIGRRR
jgi:diacylglycerol kinase (ATP)